MNIQDYREKSQVIIEGNMMRLEEDEIGIRISLDTGYGIFISRHELDYINRKIDEMVQKGNTMPKKEWIKARCQICSKVFEHTTDYTPITCGRFDCLSEANKKGLFESLWDEKRGDKNNGKQS